MAGSVGRVCLVSVAIGKKIGLLFTRRYLRKTEHASQMEGALANPRLVKRLTNVTLMIGITCLADAAVETALALFLSTSPFLIARTAIHIVALVGIIGGVYLFIWFRFSR